MKILIADDDAMSRRLLERTLAKLGYEVVAVADGNAALEALLRPDAPRLAILDWMMPGADGLTVCREVRQRSDAYAYLVLLTARDSADDMVTGLDAGADDFLTKPFDAVALRARLRAGIRVLDLQTKLLEAQEALRVQATIDHLTGLWNRRMILEQLDRELNRARRENRTLAVGIADLDHFKRVNDTHGHAAGDAVLRSTAALMRSQLREYDFVGRYGGEEFLLLLPGCGGAEASVIAERVRTCIAASPVNVDDKQLDVTLSIGLATTDVSGLDAATLVAAADEALYRAKFLGRNRMERAGSIVRPVAKARAPQIGATTI